MTFRTRACLQLLLLGTLGWLGAQHNLGQLWLPFALVLGALVVLSVATIGKRGGRP